MEMKHLTLGELLSALEAEPQENKVKFDRYSSGPREFTCYRGYYKNPCLNYGGEMTVGELAKATKEAIGATFEGYKGGQYTMASDSPLFVAADYGDCTNVIPVAVESADGITTIKTVYLEYV